MLEPTAPLIERFLVRLGEQFEHPARFYIFGGSALLLLGGPRNTGDLDFTFTIEAELAELFRQSIQAVAAETNLDLEESQPAEFMPLPAGADERHRLIGRYGRIEAYLFDLYSVALMKLDRAFPADIEDVHFLLRERHIELGELERKFLEILDRHDEKLKLRRNFGEMARGLKAGLHD